MLPSPSFSLKGSSGELLGALLPGQKHGLQVEAMSEQLKKLNQTINDIEKRLGRLHRKRSKFAQTIMNIVKHTKVTKKEPTEAASIINQKERIQRLTVCSKLLGNRCQLSSIIHNQPLPDLPPVPTAEEIEIVKEGVDVSMNKIAAFIRISQPDIITNYMNENGILYLLFLCSKDAFDVPPFNVDLSTFVKVVPPALTSIPPQNRQVIVKQMFKAFTTASALFGLFEEVCQLNEIPQMIGLIESHAANIVTARRVRLFLGTDEANELIHYNGNTRLVIPLNGGLIADSVKSMQYQIIKEPSNSPILDVAVESSIFENAKTAIICPLKHPHHKKVFVFIAIDKLREPNFNGVDFILLKYLFDILSIMIERAYQSINEVTEEDQTKLIQGLSSIAQEPNSHDMIQKITDVGNELTNATITRIFSISDENFFEETPGTKLQNKTHPIEVGLTGKTALSAETQNYVLPRREADFSVQVDDITEPRLWAMLAAPARFNGETTMVVSFYNRKSNTFFSNKEKQLVTTMASCICPFLYQTCELAKLSESLSRNATNSSRSYNLTVYSLKSIQTTGTPKIFREMHRFCETLKPHINHRLLIYDVDKLLLMPDMTVINSEPQILDAICNMKPTAATSGNKAVIVFPIKLEGINKVFLVEFQADLLQLKTAEEENGVMQRTRLLQAMEDATVNQHMSILQRDFRNNRNNISNSSLHGSASRVGFGGMSSRTQSRIFGGTSTDGLLSSMSFKGNLPFIPLPLKSIHEDTNQFNSTSLFELGNDHQNNGDKLIVVASSRKQNNSKTTFENQLDEDSLQIFPFDSFLTSILQSFSNMSTRQLLLHLTIVSMNNYKVTARALHLLGNSLACPMMFSRLLRVMMVSFTNLFGKDVKIKIFDPPLNDANETDPTTFNLERDRMIFASIKIPNALSLEKSTALASFADLLTNLIESRSQSLSPDPVNAAESCDESGFALESGHLTTNEMVYLSFVIFQRMHVQELLNVDDKKLKKWLGLMAAKSEDSGLFMVMTDSLHFAYMILTETGWINNFGESELAALAISVFLGLCYPQMKPYFKYQHILQQLVTKDTPQRSLTKVATALVLMAEEGCDILENTKENYLIGLTELMLEHGPLQHVQVLSRFHVVKNKLDFTKPAHKKLIQHVIIEASQMSMYFRPISTFGVWVVTFGKEPVPNVLHKTKQIAHRIAVELADSCPKLEHLKGLVNEKVEWLNNQNLELFVGQQDQEEDEENMSLLETR